MRVCRSIVANDGGDPACAVSDVMHLLHKTMQPYSPFQRVRVRYSEFATPGASPGLPDRMFAVTGLFQKILACRKPADRQRQRRVVVAGKLVKMTEPQARRYRELKRERATG